VVACGAEERAATMAGRHIDAQADVSSDLARVTAARAVAISLGGWVPLLLILLAAPWLTRGGATTGAVLGALTYISQGLQPALQALVRTVGGSALWLVVTLERIVEVADAPDLPPPARPVTGHPTGFDLDLRAVTFRYSPAADPVLRDLDLRIPENDHIAVVGPSGIGKSTLAGLLAGTLEPQTGQILLGGAPLPPPGELAERRVLLPQEAYVFAGTLWENLCYLRPDLTRPELDAAVDAVGLGELGARLGGYEATIEPEQLSAGERQLVTLVRAYVATAPLTVLDEATCHLDPVAEARAEHAFARRPGTLVVIAHRISSALRARRILVLDGSHAMLGTHDELVVCSPLYRDLVGCWNNGWTAVAQCDS
jgi:ATP-binding cassette subfamily C protein